MKDQKTQLNEEKELKMDKKTEVSAETGEPDDEDADGELIPEESMQEHLYNKANKRMGFAPHMYRREDQADMYRQAAELFGQVPGFEQADELREECLKEADRYRNLYIKEASELAQKVVLEASDLYSCSKAQNLIDAISAECDLSSLQEQLDGKIKKQQRKAKWINYLKKIAIVVAILAIIIVIVYVRAEMGVKITMPV